MSFFKKLIGNKKPMSITEAARELEAAGVTINAPTTDGRYVKIGGEAPEKKAIEAYNQGVDLMEKRNYIQAVEQFKKAVALSPQYTDAHYNLAMNYNRINQFESAKREYEIVLSLREFDVDALNNLGTLYAMEGRLEKAKELFDKALKSNPRDAMAHRNMAAYYQAVGNIDLKNEYVKRAIELNKNIFKE